MPFISLPGSVSAPPCSNIYRDVPCSSEANPEHRTQFPTGVTMRGERLMISLVSSVLSLLSGIAIIVLECKP